MDFIYFEHKVIVDEDGSIFIVDENNKIIATDNKDLRFPHIFPMDRDIILNNKLNKIEVAYEEEVFSLGDPNPNDTEMMYGLYIDSLNYINIEYKNDK